jgi:hypothetical protein
MARKKRRTRKRRVSGTSAYMGSPRKRTRKRRMHGAYVGAPKKHRKHRRRMGAGGGFVDSTKEFAMILLGGGMAKIGADIMNPLMYGIARGPLVPALMKGAIGAFLFNQSGQRNPILMGASIGLAVSGLEDVGRALELPWMPFLPLETTAEGKYLYRGMHGPQDLFVVLPENRQVNGPDVPVISGNNDVPVISGNRDVPVIGGGENTYLGAENEVLFQG